MQSFKDLQGQSWEIRLTVFLRSVIRKRAGVDVLALMSKETLLRLKEETELWIEIIWALVEKQANGRAIDIETFFTDHIDERLLEEIIDLVYEESIEYAPEKKRPNMRKMLRMMKRTGTNAIEILTTHIKNIDEDAVVSEATATLERSLRTKSTDGSLSSLEASESVQTREASES